MSITLSAKQVKNLLEFGAPDHETETEQLETEVTIFELKEPQKCIDTGDDMPAGIYAYLTEYPEEGSVYLTDD